MDKIDLDTQDGELQLKSEYSNNGMTNDRHHRQVHHLGNCKYIYFSSFY